MIACDFGRELMPPFELFEILIGIRCGTWVFSIRSCLWNLGNTPHNFITKV